MTIESLYDDVTPIKPSKAFSEKAIIKTDDDYNKANTDRLKFWEEQAKQLTWDQAWDTPLKWERPIAKWFVNGKLNATTNCLDRHIMSKKTDKTALIWESESGDKQSLSYKQLHDKVCRLANYLSQSCNIKKGDRVTLYMSLTPELAIAVLACARIGAIHSVVFAGFSAESLQDRLNDSESVCIITGDIAIRRGKSIKLKEIVDQALDNAPSVKHVLVHKRTTEIVNWVNNRDHDFNEALNSSSSYHEPESMDSEDPLFILYTSGTTGKPKGIIHTTGGYLTHAQYSTKIVFDLKDDDIYWCTADIGWITGHTYLIYGPLLNGATVFMYEGTPDYPNEGIFWDLIQRYKISIFYTAPTAIRAFMKSGESIPEQYNLASLRLLGSVGEPINPEAWNWYYTHIGQKQCPIVDTWWQTETGGIMITTLPGLHDMKPGSAGKPLPGIQAQCLHDDGTAIHSGGGLLSLTEPWPSMARGIWGDSKRFNDVYWSKFDTYFAGDGAIVDDNGYFTLLGRVDDVLNVAGHRIGTMEVESSLVDCPKVAEAAVIGIQDRIKGQAILAFVILKEGISESIDLENELKQFVAKKISPIAKPKAIIFTPDLPKTRSGKIMRRLLKQAANNETLGDTTSLSNPQIIKDIQKQLSK
ncbi:acetate--CoA ligase [bacterium]|nr:acetate--CoA ligase [bacterium]|tara:strand:- start:212 stop:2137 length:1926 start_codon:yes stop_codon:yes gene_type:complete